MKAIDIHAITFSDLKTMFGVASYDHWLLVSLFSAPILLWFMVLGCATMVLMTKSYTVHPDDPEDARRIIDEIADTKQRWLVWGLRMLMASFVVLFVDIIIFLGAR